MGWRIEMLLLITLEVERARDGCLSHLRKSLKICVSRTPTRPSVVRLRSGLAARGISCKRSVSSLIPSASGILSCTKYQKGQVMSKLYANAKKSLDNLEILKQQLR